MRRKSALVIFGLFSVSVFAIESISYFPISKYEFSPALSETEWAAGRLNTNIEYDFDGDGSKDKVTIELSKNKDSYRVVAYLTTKRKDQVFELWKRQIPTGKYDGVWETIWLKKPGEKGASKHKYFNAPGKNYPYLSEYSEKDIKEYENAVAEYVSLPAIEATDSESPSQDPEDLFYCKQQYYYKGGSFHRLFKCD